ncbi:hypothetical protein KAT24_01560 [Candidatus Pacearchaeota archaeon]|nr:hypothetical protein [Candidatus Pacearchaeota archaeon]
MEKDLGEKIILRNKTICGPGVNPLELCLVVGAKYKIDEEDNRMVRSSLSYSFEQY